VAEPIGRSSPQQRVLAFFLSERRRAILGSAARVLTLEGPFAGAPVLEAREYDGAWLAPEGIGGVDLAVLGERVARVLPPGAPIVCVVAGPCPLPALLECALTGEGEVRGALRSRVEGSPARGVTAGELKRAFGPAFAWRRAYALGVLMPPPSRGDWAARHPLAFGALAATEHVVRGWPLLRALGAWTVLEGERTGSARATPAGGGAGRVL